MSDQNTSEEKLLKLIRKKNPSGTSLKTDAKKEQTKPLSFLDRPKQADGLKALRFLNRLLLVVIVLVAAYISMRYFVMERDETQVAQEGAETKEGEETVKAISKPQKQKPFEVYQDVMSRRNVFISPWEKGGGQLTTGEVPHDLSRQVRIVGIVLDKDPKVIVEDIVNKQTVFLSPGERIGNAVVEEIQEGKVIFLFNDEKVELTLTP